MKPRIFLLDNGQWACGIVQLLSPEEQQQLGVRWLAQHSECGTGTTPEDAYADWYSAQGWATLTERLRGALLH